MVLRPVTDGRLVMQGVVRAFGDQRVVDGFDLVVGAGEVVGLWGANGSGKTTILRLIAGTLTADAGTIAVCGGPPGRGASAFAPAGDRGLYWRISVLDNLRFAARIGSLGRRGPAAVAEAAERFGLTGMLRKRVEACSTGQRRRLMMARAAVSGAPVLVVDEPFEGLDEAGRSQVTALAQGWAADGGLVIWAAPTEGQGPPSSSIIALGRA